MEAPNKIPGASPISHQSVELSGSHTISQLGHAIQHPPGKHLDELLQKIVNAFQEHGTFTEETQEDVKTKVFELVMSAGLSDADLDAVISKVDVLVKKYLHTESSAIPTVALPPSTPISREALKNVAIEDSNLMAFIINGFETRVLDYVKSKSDTSEITQSLVQGPQARSPETKMLEDILHGLLEKPDGYRFFIKPDNSACYLTGSDKKFVLDPKTNRPLDFFDLIKTANFSQLTFSNSQLQKFEEFFDKSHKLTINADHNLESLPTNDGGVLTRGETLAINLYTSYNLTGEIQKIAQGRMSELLSNVDKSKKDEVIKEILLAASVGISGLNKLTKFSEESDKTLLFRFDANLPEHLLKERINAVEEGGKVTTLSGYVSTSHTRPAFIKGNVVTLFENCKASSIQDISKYKAEREVTLPPTQVQWTHYHKVRDGNGQEYHVFIAKAVTTPEENPTRPVGEIIAENLPPPKN